MATDDKVVIGLTTALDDPERVLLGYLMGVEALRKGKQVLFWLTKDAVHIGTEGFAAKAVIPDVPSTAELHEEFVASGGRMYACPVCVKTRGLTDAQWVPGAEVKGAPSLYEFTEGGALTFTY